MYEKNRPVGLVMMRNTKQQLLEKGVEVFTQKGYNHSGIKEILDAAGVPKGSFYHFFKSKEDFGLQVLGHYGRLEIEMVKAVFLDERKTPLERLRFFFTCGFEQMADGGFCGGCLIGNLTQELADLSPVFAARLESLWREMEVWIARCIRQAQEGGELAANFEPDAMASFLVNAWQGVIMRSKLAKSRQPFHKFFSTVFEGILAPINTSP